ncbi:MAG: hypothetical protein WCW56_02960 [Candidatus Paceibacterota bacterium]|jgi:hypothetical protein
MREIFEHLKTKTKLRILAGFSLVIFGLIIHLIPLVPGSWAIVIGLEILGIRLLLQDKIKVYYKNSKFLQKFRWWRD